MSLTYLSNQSQLCKSKVRNFVQEAAAQMGISTLDVTRGLLHSLKPNLPKRCTVCKKTLAGNATHVRNPSVHSIV